MTYGLIPNFSVPMPAPAATEIVPFHADPILAAIDRHNEAWAVFQIAAAGAPSLDANDEMDAALTALLGTPCASRAGAFALLGHLRWFLEEEASNAGAYGSEWAVAQAREADLTLLLGCDGVRRIPVALPLGRVASVPVRHEVPAPLLIKPEPIRAPALVCLSRALSSAGELLAGLVLIGGGCALIGISTHL